MVGRLERVPLREVWQHEALDFTRWLRDDIDVLGETLGITLSDAECEGPAGDFNVDIIAQDEDGNPVIIENQLEKSDHDHLGKLITYLTAIEAHTALWIVADPRPEHVRAITWLNEFSPVAFYLVKVEAVRIGESEPAPLLTLIVGPSEEARQAGEAKKGMAERYGIRKAFWTGLLERAGQRTSLHSTISPQPSGWIWAGAGVRGLSLNYGIKQHAASVGLYIDRGKGEDEQTESIFRQLEAHQSEVEATYGGPVNWDPLEGKRACWVGVQFSRGGYRDDEETWPEIQDEMIEAMIKLEKALRPYIDTLEL